VTGLVLACFSENETNNQPEAQCIWFIVAEKQKGALPKQNPFLFSD